MKPGFVFLKKMTFVGVIVFLQLFCMTDVVGQSIFNVKGIVVDETGAPLPGLSQ